MKIEVCSAYVPDRIIYFYKIIDNNKAKSMYKISETEYNEIIQLLANKGYKNYIKCKVWIQSHCLIFYNVDEETINEITSKYGELMSLLIW